MITRLAVTVKSRCTYANAVTPGAHRPANPNPVCQVHPGAYSTDTLTADAGADPGSGYRVRVRWDVHIMPAPCVGRLRRDMNFVTT